MRLPILTEQRIEELTAAFLKNDPTAKSVAEKAAHIDITIDKPEDVRTLFKGCISLICICVLKKALEGQPAIADVLITNVDFRHPHIYPKNWDAVVKTCHTIIGRAYRMIPTLHAQTDQIVEVQKERNWDTSFSYGLRRGDRSMVATHMFLKTQRLKDAAP